MTPSGRCLLDFSTILVWISRWKFWISWWKFWISWWQCYWVGDTNVTPPCSGVDDGPTSWAKEALISDIAICQARFRPNFPLLIFSNWRHFFRVNLNHQRYRTLYLLLRATFKNYNAIGFTKIYSILKLGHPKYSLALIPFCFTNSCFCFNFGDLSHYMKKVN